MPQEPPLTPVLRELRNLFMNSGEWRQLPGPPEFQVFMHTFPDGTVDVLTIRDESDADVVRTNPDGAPVKSETGTLRRMIALLRRMPPPGSLHAPKSVVQARRKRLDADAPPWL